MDRRDFVASMEDDFEQQVAQLGDVARKLASLTVNVTSPDQLVHVIVNGSGVLVDVQFAADAYQRSTPQQLAESLKTAVRAAVDTAVRTKVQVSEPLTAIADRLPDFDEIQSGAPSLRALREDLREPIAPDTPAPHGRHHYS